MGCWRQVKSTIWEFQATSDSADSKLDGMGPEARREAREEGLRPLMESFREWAEGAIGRAVPGLALHRALAYALRHWPYVMNVLEDGRLGLDNNIALDPDLVNAQFRGDAA